MTKKNEKTELCDKEALVKTIITMLNLYQYESEEERISVIATIARGFVMPYIDHNMVLCVVKDDTEEANQCNAVMNDVVEAIGKHFDKNLSIILKSLVDMVANLSFLNDVSEADVETLAHMVIERYSFLAKQKKGIK